MPDAHVKFYDKVYRDMMVSDGTDENDNWYEDGLKIPVTVVQERTINKIAYGDFVIVVAEDGSAKLEIRDDE